MRRWLPLLLLAPGLAEAGDPVEGRRLAAQWCADCHRIAAAGPGPATDAVPAFAAIAARPGAGEAGIIAFLRNPHGAMPDPGLTPRQAEDLAAYILAQRPR